MGGYKNQVLPPKTNPPLVCARESLDALIRAIGYPRRILTAVGCSTGDSSVAEWLPAHGLAIVRHQRGALLQRMGLSSSLSLHCEHVPTERSPSLHLITTLPCRHHVQGQALPDNRRAHVRPESLRFVIITCLSPECRRPMTCQDHALCHPCSFV